MSSDNADRPLGQTQRLEIVVPPATPNLPAVVPVAATRGRDRSWRRRVLLLLVLLAAAAGGYAWFHAQPALPPGIVAANGRLEADQIDVATKFAGRVAQLFVDEGDMVKASQVVATMDTRDLAASLRKAQSLASQAQQVLGEAQANVAQQQTQVTLAKQEFDRTATLVPRGVATVELLDQRRQRLNAATAALNAASARVAVAEHALAAAQHDIELYQVNIADNTLVAPRDGRIEYRVTNVGEVLPVGGKVFTMLDTGYVYMDVYLPTAEAGRIKLGSDARIVLDAYPTRPIPAKVVFLATRAQFTPKTVETKDERDKLMFRLRVRIDPDRLRERADAVRSGLPGMTYLRIDPNVPWPSNLQPYATSPPQSGNG